MQAPATLGSWRKGQGFAGIRDTEGGRLGDYLEWDRAWDQKMCPM